MGARDSAQDFYYADNKDLYDFVKRVDAATKDAAVKSLGQGRRLAEVRQVGRRPEIGS